MLSVGEAGTSDGVDTTEKKFFDVTASGTFNKDDFRVKSTGIAATPAGAGRVSDLAMSDLQIEDTPIGGGASGMVRRALHVPTKKMIAVKSINVTDKSKCDQMMTELKILVAAEKVCPNVVQFFDAFWQPPFVHLAIELMDGGSLDHQLAACQVPSEEVVAVIIRQLCNGINFLHKERHNLHRDMKPGNVLINSQGNVKVADFGISRSMENTMALAATFTGTAIYMAPERMEGKPYSFPADVWAVGLIAFECAVGRYPYSLKADMKYFDLVMTIVNQPPPLPGATCSKELNSFIESALTKAPQHRGTCESLLQHDFISKFKASEEACVGAWMRKGDVIKEDTEAGGLLGP